MMMLMMKNPIPISISYGDKALVSFRIELKRSRKNDEKLNKVSVMMMVTKLVVEWNDKILLYFFFFCQINS